MTSQLKRRTGAAAISVAGLLLLAFSPLAPGGFPPEVRWNWTWSFAVAGLVLFVAGLWLWIWASKGAILKPRHVLMIGLSTWLMAFAIPAIDDGNQQTGFARRGLSATDNHPGQHWNRVLHGWEVFLRVPAYLPLSYEFMLSWLANPLLWAALVLLRKGQVPKATRAAAVCGVLALSSALALPGKRHWLTPLGGYYLWVGSLLVSWLALSLCQPSRPKHGFAVEV